MSFVDSTAAAILLVLKEAFGLLAESAVYLLFGFLLAGISHFLLDGRSSIQKHLARGGFGSVFFASLIGMPMPLCSCSVLPAAIGLRREGASKGATASFLISVPETDIISLILSWVLLGPVMAIARPVVAFITAMGTGLAIDRFTTAETQAEPAEVEPVPAPSCCCSGENEPASRPNRLRRILHYSFVELLDDLAPLMLLGFLLAGILAALLSRFDLMSLSSVAPWSHLAMLAIGIPTYVCASASTPVAAALLLGGFSPGAVLVFLMAGPATNSASLVVLAKSFGKQILIVYLLGIILFSLAAGLLLDLWWNDPFIPSAGSGAEHHAHETSLLNILAAIAFLGLAGGSLIRKWKISSRLGR